MAPVLNAGASVADGDDGTSSVILCFGGSRQPSLPAPSPRAQAGLDKLEARYDGAVQAHARKVYKQYVKPLLDKYDACFSPGMGNWYIGLDRSKYPRITDQHGALREDTALCRRLDKYLTASTTTGQMLGSLMPDRKPKTWSRR